VRRVWITHPFHPLHGRTFVLVDERRNRHGDRVWFRADDGRARSVPASWTSLGVPDAFAVTAAGRASFRPEDLLALAALLDALRQCNETQGAQDV
jgi:hypothetical protein